MNGIISAVLVVGGLGLLFGCILAFAYSVFYVPQDERIYKISEVLPGANCGGCGFAGCSAFASAVVKGDASVSACTVGKAPVAEKIADIMGVSADKAEANVACVVCTGDCDNAPSKYEYIGVPDCASMAKLSGGSKECSFGCLGLGSCVNACKFDAIKIENGIAVIDPTKCTGCGSCVKKCPKQVIALIPQSAQVVVKCKNADKGAVANKVCKNSCIGCKLCEKTCESGAISVEDNLASIDYTKCTGCGECSEKCRKNAIYKI